MFAIRTASPPTAQGATLARFERAAAPCDTPWDDGGTA